MHALPDYTIYSLGDTAITIDFGNHIDKSINEIVLSLHAQISAQPFKGFIESVPSYSSLTVYYDPWLMRDECKWELTICELVTEKINKLIEEAQQTSTVTPRQISVPVCYEGSYAIDMKAICLARQITRQEIIHLHTTQLYRVYMLGFLPGFAYMGEIDDRLLMPRKPSPQNIKAGSVGITGKQTGIYPMQSPGGWNIIGRTPVKLFESNGDTVTTLFEPGDIVQFYSITSHEFENY